MSYFKNNLWGKAPNPHLHTDASLRTQLHNPYKPIIKRIVKDACRPIVTWQILVIRHIMDHIRNTLEMRGKA